MNNYELCLEERHLHRPVAKSLGDPLAVELYRLVECGGEIDLRYVFRATVNSCVIPASPFTLASRELDSSDPRVVFAYNSLLTATSELGDVPARRAYDGWRDSRSYPSEFASSSMVRRVLGDGSWQSAAEVVGRPSRDVTARRILSPADAFTEPECSEAVRMFLSDSELDRWSRAAYRDWATRYRLADSRRRVPRQSQTLLDRLGFETWSALLREFQPTLAGRSKASTKGEVSP
jgi:hypothetical protein